MNDIYNLCYVYKLVDWMTLQVPIKTQDINYKHSVVQILHTVFNKPSTTNSDKLQYNYQCTTFSYKSVGKI